MQHLEDSPEDHKNNLEKVDFKIEKLKYSIEQQLQIQSDDITMRILSYC